MHKNCLSIYDVNKCAFFALGRNAMYAACQVLNLKEQDEILTPAFDCDGSLQPFRILGYKLKFFRSDPYTFNADIADIRRKITPKTRLIHIINHFGMPQPWNELLALRREVNILILEDNAYSLFSKTNGRSFGTFGDISVFSLRKNLPLIDGGLLRINNSAYSINITKKKTQWCYPTEYPELLRFLSRKLQLFDFGKYIARRLGIFSNNLPPPPLYSEIKDGYPNWPLRDSIGKEFYCDYLRPMSRLAETQLSKFNEADFIDIIKKKRYYYNWLSIRLSNIRGITVLWPKLPEGIVPFCFSCLIDNKRDIFFEVLRRRYEVMAWPTLSKLVLTQLDSFPELVLLGKKLLQINLSADRVRSVRFPVYLENLIRDMDRLSIWNITG